jgi:hypothetical protein
VLLAALALNYGGLAARCLRNSEWRRRPAVVRPALEAIPPLAAGGALSAAAIRGGQYDLLFGIWMALYGLVHIPYRLSLPAANYRVGLAYVACGIACLAWPGLSFTNPWPMGIVFFVGEVAGGWILYRGNREAQKDG